MPNLGSLARTLMKKTIAIAGNGTKEVSVTILEGTTYNTVDGTFTRTDESATIGKALLGVVSEMEAAKFKLEVTTHKLVVAMLDYEASGLVLPLTSDKLTIGTAEWLIEKVIVGPFNEAVWFYVCAA